MKLENWNRTSLWLATTSLFAGFVFSIGATVAADEEMVPDFSLLDVNTTSATYNQLVSPRDYLGQVSCWYFAHAT